MKIGQILSSLIRNIIPSSAPSSGHPREGTTVSGDDTAVIRAFVEDQVVSPSTFNSRISETDEMYLFALRSSRGNRDRAYIENLATGKQSMTIIREIIRWNFGGFENISAFLDFASGYGRLTRFLVQELAPERIWVCDIYANAIAFQQEQFGVHGIVSVPAPEDFRDDRRYDCIFVASLFSHLPELTFRSWLTKLYERLTPRGLLVFSVHDAAVLPPHLSIDETGFLFLPESESRSLSTSEYGTTYVAEPFVRRIIESVAGHVNYYRKKRGLWCFQDVYIIPKNPEQDFSRFSLSPGPFGYLDRCFIGGSGELCFVGWAAEFSDDARITNIQILAGGKTLLQCKPSFERADVAEAFQDDRGMRSGFACSLKKNSVNADDIIVVKIVNSRNVEHVLRIGTLESILD